MDSLGLIYIRKVFSLFMYVIHERRYCHVIWKRNFWFKKRRRCHYHRLASDGEIYYLRFWL